MILKYPYAYKLTDGSDVIVDIDTEDKSKYHFRISRLDDTSHKFFYSDNNSATKNNDFHKEGFTKEEAEAIKRFFTQKGY